MILNQRPRRLRVNAKTRDLVAETALTPQNLIQPIFVTDHQDEAIKSMPGQMRLTLKSLGPYIKEISDLGISGVALFPSIQKNLKTKDAKEAYNSKGLIPEALKLIKSIAPDLLTIADVALDPYSSDGHDGLVDQHSLEILNDETVEVLKLQALMLASAGADFVAPSDMMDGRIGAIREALEEGGFKNTGIISYTAKYASALYGPFRDALDSAPQFGDKKTYQMDPRNVREALLEASLDEQEGADILMVKPAGFYLDVIAALKENFTAPIAAYQVSGEFAMIRAAGEKGWISEEKLIDESLLSIRRAGASVILTYFAVDFSKRFLSRKN